MFYYVNTLMSSFTNKVGGYNYTSKIIFKIKYFILILIFYSLVFTIFTQPHEWSWFDVPKSIEEPKNNKEYYSSYFFNMFHFSIVSFTNTGYGDISPITNKTKCLTHLLLFTAYFIAIL